MCMEQKDKNTIAFIICVNNELYFDECQFYIDRLTIPKGYNINIISIREADSMCAAYNVGMQSSDAKYKIYMHQDVMIREIHFLEYIIELFKQNENVGMIGMIGGTQMPKTGVTYRAWNVGMVDCRDPDMAYFMAGAKDMPQTDTIVEAIDGLLMATQYDIPWREDLFTHFDFYDVSQSFEMRKAGYQILVPYQEIPWVIHDSGFAKLTYYDEERRKCLKEYPEYLYADGGFEFIYDKEWNELSDILAEHIKCMIEQEQWERVGESIISYRKSERKSSILEMLGILYNIWEKERNADVLHSFFENSSNYKDIHWKYISVRFFLRRIEMGMARESYIELEDAIRKKIISYEAVIEIMIHAVINKNVVLKELLNIYNDCELKQEYTKCKQLLRLTQNNKVVIAYSKQNEVKGK